MNVFVKMFHVEHKENSIIFYYSECKERINIIIDNLINVLRKYTCPCGFSLILSWSFSIQLEDFAHWCNGNKGIPFHSKAHLY